MLDKGEDNLAPEEIEEMLMYEDVLSIEETEDSDEHKLYGLTYKERLGKFENSIDTNVEASLSNCDEIKQIIRDNVDCMVPKKWTGINGDCDGLLPLKIETEGLPPSLGCRNVFLNPVTEDYVRKEIIRLSTYTLTNSNSRYASPINPVDKKEPPYVRIAIDYRQVNKYIVCPQPNSNNPKHELDKITRGGFKYFASIDAKNAYHQVRLSEQAQELLAIKTPLGQLQPKFMPEGMSIAAFVLQKVVDDVFHEFEDFMIVLADNFLILAKTEEDLAIKLKTVYAKCVERNVIINMAKSEIGYSKLDFWGYTISTEGYEVSEKRIQGITNFKFPDVTLSPKAKKKYMQSFLGTALVCKDFVNNYSDHTTKLNDMTHNDFNWNEDEWKEDYRSIFEDVKRLAKDAIKIYFPDYSLRWELETDASAFAVGAMLVQYKVMVNKDGDEYEEKQPIGVVSKKFSEVASRWSTIEQEGYGIFYGVKSFDYYLKGKEFTVCTDHRNLLWMELSSINKIVRWRLFLQGFKFKLKHIPGKLNFSADALSRLLFMKDHEASNEEDIKERCLQVKELRDMITVSDVVGSIVATEILSKQELFDKVHGDREPHLGIGKTWTAIKRMLPSSTVTNQDIAHMIEKCGVCNKMKTAKQYGLPKEVPKQLIKEGQHNHAIMGLDVLAISPNSHNKNYLVVIVNLMNKMVYFEAVEHHNAESVSDVVSRYIALYGRYDEITTDPGSELVSNIFKDLMKVLMMKHKISLVMRHESCGVEQVNRDILYHLRCLCMEDLNIKVKWSESRYIHWLMFTINNIIDPATNLTPFEKMFGRMKCLSEQLNLSNEEIESQYIKDQQQELEEIKDIVNQAWKKKREKILKKVKDTFQYSKGDLVLEKSTGEYENMSMRAKNKLAPIYMGPYEVLEQKGNNVGVRHLSSGRIKEVFVDRLKLFNGSRENGIKLAHADMDQFEIECITDYKGDRLNRYSMQFRVLYKDGDVYWMNWSNDITATNAFEKFCSERSELRLLIYSKQEETIMRRKRKKEPIFKSVMSTNGSRDFVKELLNQGERRYLSLSYWGNSWLHSLNLPGVENNKVYVVEAVVGKYTNKTNSLVRISVPIFNEIFIINYEIYLDFFVYKDVLENFVVLDDSLIKSYPMVLQN